MNENSIPQLRSIRFFFDEQEQRLHNWMEALSLVEPVSKTYVTARLVRCVARQLLPEESASQTSVLIERMKSDFGLIHLDSQGRLLWRGRSGLAEKEKNALRAQLYEHREDILVLLDSPVSLCCLHQLLAVKLTPLDQVCILERLLERIQATQQYDLILLYWLPMIGPMFSTELEAETRFRVVSLYQRLHPQALDILLHLFERSGQFTEAIKLATYLHPLNPVQYGIVISSLQERLGNFEDACSQLEKIVLPPQVDPPQPVAVRLYQRRAWLVVSGRLEHKKELGKEALSQLASLLFSHSAFNEPLWLWHYHNITANYAEWDGDYACAIGEYRKCLRIPGLGDFEYGASFVNLAISQRLIFLGDPTQEENLHQAIENGELGLLLKHRVGDRDEMPVVLHNQALNILYGVLYGVLPFNRLEDVLRLAQEGLAIVEATYSVKRRAILTAEILLASALSGQETSLWKEKMRDALPRAMDSEKKEILAMHALALGQHGLGILKDF